MDGTDPNDKDVGIDLVAPLFRGLSTDTVPRTTRRHGWVLAGSSMVYLYLNSGLAVMDGTNPNDKDVSNKDQVNRLHAYAAGRVCTRHCWINPFSFRFVSFRFRSLIRHLIDSG